MAKHLFSFEPVVCSAISAVIILGAIGCGGGPEPQSPAEAGLKAIYVMYGQYAGQNRGKSPPDVEAFKKFVRSTNAEQLKSLNVNDVESLFISPRDKQPYVVHYNAAVSVPGVGVPAGDSWLAYEETGQGGKKYILLSTGIIEEVDAVRFGEIVQ